MLPVVVRASELMQDHLQLDADLGGGAGRDPALRLADQEGFFEGPPLVEVELLGPPTLEAAGRAVCFAFH